MTINFNRLSAGIYEVQKNSNTVGFIRRATASKWIVADVVDTPQHVSKTLKEAKDACQGDPECNFICDLLDLAGGCTVSIAAGCAGHCANQGIAPPPTKDPLLASTTNDPYCFD